MACSASPSSAVPTKFPSLQELWAGGKQVIVFFPATDMEAIQNHIFGGLVWSDDLIQNASLPKNQTTSELLDTLDISLMVPGLPRPLCDGRPLRIVKAVLSPDMSMVFGRYEYRSMRELSTHMTSPAVAGWVHGKVGVNVILIDFVGIGDVIRHILNLNSELAKRLSAMSA